MTNNVFGGTVNLTQPSTFYLMSQKLGECTVRINRYGWERDTFSTGSMELAQIWIIRN